MSFLKIRCMKYFSSLNSIKMMGGFYFTLSLKRKLFWTQY